MLFRSFFTFMLLLLCVSLALSGLFRFIGAAAASTVHAQAGGSIGLLVLILTSGFSIIRSEPRLMRSEPRACLHASARALPARPQPWRFVPRTLRPR